ncbi:hypothetical protein AGDE_05078 [Angomonas deanei]|uniref:Dynein assembly factor 3 C-terminal domain-containing protein n=1 Tax=Angomonas deanei TaxID=59799 RepID=A0A7G2C8W7_9TRYP|nr:hypothetical protein AGDE_05078 [Angomonas deanei]CAD2215564.1 Domain of unknown function (DUF4471), putative [Angomonas deanei]|eukprot:EPY38851.1 hypothetical protein AGDE_05078 [Angomonas deanei]
MFSFEEMEERVLMFLEVFGNTQVRDITVAQIRNVSHRLSTFFQSGDHSSDGLAGYVDFKEMKMKERDFVEEQIAHWSKESSVCATLEQWQSRVQQDLAERYDNRDNLIDWDFVFRLTDYTNLLKFPEYRVWRNTGVAFDVSHINPRRGFEYNYTNPNKTLCFFDKKGRGFFNGDIKCGPFFAFGAKTENKEICFRTADGTCRYGNGVVSMHNIRAWLYTLMTGLQWPWADHKFAWDDEKNYNYLPPGTPSTVEHKVQFPRVKVHLVGLDFNRFLTRMNGKHQMQAAFFGASCTSFMTESLFRTLMAADGIVLAETAKFIVDAEEEAKVAYEDKILEFATAGGWGKDAPLTAHLHENQPEPKKGSEAETTAQQTTLRRYNMPFQIALKKQ